MHKHLTVLLQPITRAAVWPAGDCTKVHTNAVMTGKFISGHKKN